MRTRYDTGTTRCESKGWTRRQANASGLHMLRCRARVRLQVSTSPLHHMGHPHPAADPPSRTAVKETTWHPARSSTAPPAGDAVWSLQHHDQQGYQSSAPVGSQHLLPLPAHTPLSPPTPRYKVFRLNLALDNSLSVDAYNTVDIGHAASNG